MTNKSKCHELLRNERNVYEGGPSADSRELVALSASERRKNLCNDKR